MLDRSDDRGLCRVALELAFRPSPSANADNPDQQEWIRALLSSSAFGQDAKDLRDQFNGMRREGWEKVSLASL